MKKVKLLVILFSLGLSQLSFASNNVLDQSELDFAFGANNLVVEDTSLQALSTVQMKETEGDFFIAFFIWGIFAIDNHSNHKGQASGYWGH